MKVELNLELEALSEKVRMGEPVSLSDAIRVIDYQNKLSKARSINRINRKIFISSIILMILGVSNIGLAFITKHAFTLWFGLLLIAVSIFTLQTRDKTL